MSIFRSFIRRHSSTYSFQIVKQSACFSNGPETYRARKAIFSYSVSRNRELYTAETSCVKGTSGHIKNVEPRFNEPLFNEVLDITNDTLRPGQNYSKMYGIEPRCNEPRYNEFLDCLDITNIIRKPKRKYTSI